MDQQKFMRMSKEHLVDRVARLLKTGMDLDFLLELREKDLEKLVACLRDPTGKEENKQKGVGKKQERKRVCF